MIFKSSDGVIFAIPNIDGIIFQHSKNRAKKGHKIRNKIKNQMLKEIGFER